MFLTVGIDTESDNQWEVQARANPTFENIYALPRLHALFTTHGVRPSYVVTYPVARDPASAAVLRQLHAQGDCELGAHHHAWETPPCSPEDIPRHAYALGLSLDRFEAQLTHLTGAVANITDIRPRTYRSGRFGLAAEHVPGLEREGYDVDSTVAPLFYEAHKGGPDFVGAPLDPYFLSYDDVRGAGTSRLLEIPVTAALNRRVPAALARAYARAPRPYATKRVLRLLGVARVIWLRPSYASLEDMMSLARRLAADGHTVLNVIFHSSEAIVGGSPYNRTAAELEQFLDRLSRFLRFAVEELGAEPATLGECRDRICGVAEPLHSSTLAAREPAGQARGGPGRA